MPVGRARSLWGNALASKERLLARAELGLKRMRITIWKWNVEACNAQSARHRCRMTGGSVSQQRSDQRRGKFPVVLPVYVVWPLLLACATDLPLGSSLDVFAIPTSDCCAVPPIAARDTSAFPASAARASTGEIERLTGRDDPVDGTLATGLCLAALRVTCWQQRRRRRDTNERAPREGGQLPLQCRGWWEGREGREGGRTNGLGLGSAAGRALLGLPACTGLAVDRCACANLNAVQSIKTASDSPSDACAEHTMRDARRFKGASRVPQGCSRVP